MNSAPMKLYDKAPDLTIEDSLQAITDTVHGTSDIDQKKMVAIELILLGTPRVDIANQLGVSAGCVTRWMLEPSFKELLESRRSELHSTIKTLVDCQLQNLAPEAIAKIATLMRSAQSEKVQLDAGRDLADRAGYKPVERHQVSQVVNLPPDIIEFARTVIQEMSMKTING